ncbi:hypothetical protein CKA32_006065 [Geitlerinema sp. FC II]|nr:hypothetical protein CKA32_006065 [Geitlerinema sp. FC II]
MSSFVRAIATAKYCHKRTISLKFYRFRGFLWAIEKWMTVEELTTGWRSHVSSDRRSDRTVYVGNKVKPISLTGDLYTKISLLR